MQRSVRFIGGALAAAVAMAGCKGDGGTGPNPSITLSLSKSASSIVQGGSDQVTATVTRTNFSGTVNVTVEGAPTGVTGSVSNVSASGNTTTATVTIAVDVATAPGTYTLSVKAAGDPAAPSTVSFALTVTAKPDFGLSLDPATLSIQAGGTGTSAVTITRTNFTDAITLTLTGAPTGVTGTFDPAAPTGDTSTLTIAVGASVTPGTYDLHVVGNASGIGDHGVALTLTVTAPPVGSYTLSASPNPVSIQQGANGPVTITIARTNFTDDVALSLVGAPTGVTAAFSPATLSGSTATSTLTITVGSTVTAGNISLTVNGTVAGSADVTAALTLTVTAAPAQGFSLSATQASIQAGSNGTSIVTITRTGGFSGTVHLTVQTAPSGVTGSFNPTDASGTSSTLTLTVTGSVTAGNYMVTIKGSSSGQPDATFDIALTVTAASGGSIHWDYSTCKIKPVWFAVQDGSGPWTQVVGVNFVFSFNLSSPTGAVAFTLNSGANTTVLVTFFLTLAEAQAGNNCVSASGKSLTGTAAGLGATDNAEFSLGGSFANATAGGLLFTFQNVALGTFDLFGYRRDATSPGVGDKLLITRDLHTNSIATVGTQDFSGGSAIDPASGNLTITGGTGGEQFQVGMNYYSGSACTKATFYNGLPDVATTQTMLGVPNANRRTNDWHQVTVSGFDGSTAYRSVMESFQAIGNRSVALPSHMPSTSATAVAFAPYKRLHYVTTLPSDLRSLAAFHYEVPGGTHSVQLNATAGFVTGGTFDVTTPDWTTAAGFDPTWVPPASATVSWLAEAFGTAATACSNGARSVFASHLGTL